MFGGPSGFLHMHSYDSIASSIALFVSMSERMCVLKDGKVVSVCADCKIRDILGEMGYSDQEDYVINMRTNTTATAAKQDVELADKVQLHAEFGRWYVYFHLLFSCCSI